MSIVCKYCEVLILAVGIISRSADASMIPPAVLVYILPIIKIAGKREGDNRLFRFSISLG